ncbi:MAG: hypothetical protein JWN61_896, partial [Pseudonocardiales bacterium]|nr:hypothetical protein [Pseudonocardiales bacterium]
MITVSRALQRRMARLRSGDREAGIVLPFVLLVTLLVVILATTVASLTISKVRPASRTVNSAAATAAAQAGIDAFTAFLATTCPQPGRCAAINSTVAAGTLPGSDGAGQSTYTWQVLNALYYVTDQFLRVQSIGLSRGVRKVLIADFQGTPNLLDFAYYTEFETASPTDLLKQYGPRAIRITDATIGALTTPTLAANSTLTWAGAKTTAMTGASPTTSVDICNRRYYDTVSGSTAVQGRYTLRAKLPRNGDWAETGASGASTFTHNGQCEVAFGSSSQFIGPVYSLDALLLSNGVVGGPGPNFQQSVSSAWASTSTPPAPLGAPWRSQLVVGGAPTGTNRPITVNYQLNLPPAVTAAQFPAGNGTCVYTGPTRIKIDGAFAVVTSPQTTTIPLGNVCNPNADPAIAGSAGVAGARIALANLRIAYIADGADTTTQVSGKSPITSANSVFSLSSPTVAPISTTPAAGAVTADLLKQFPGCTLLSCLLGTAEQRFTTETGKTPEQLQVLVQAGAGASTAFNPQTYLQSRLPADTAAVRYRALAAVPGSAGPTAGTPTVASLAASTDPFFAATTGSRTQTPYTTSTSSAVAIVRQVATCSLLGAFGICIGTAGWSTDDPQIALTVNR